MARVFEFIKDITDRKDLWKITVKVKDKWNATKEGKDFFQIVVVDSKGDDIFVLVPNELKQKFENEIPITVNNTYTMQNFQVTKNDDQFKPSHHEFKLRFTGGTLVEDVNVHQIADPVAKFKSFGDILNGDFREDYLYDVIGLVDEVGYQQPHYGNRKVQVNFILRDLGNNVINCTLWENYALKFFNVQNKANEGPTIVFMKYAKVKHAGLLTGNTFNIVSLAAGIESGTITNVTETPSQMMSQSSGGSQFTPYTAEQKFTHNAEVMPLSKIVQLAEDTKCVTVVDTVKIKPNKSGWYYLTCYKCPKQCFGDAPPYRCIDKHETETEIIRYKMDIEVAAGDVKATCVFWDRECAQLLGISASDLRAEMLGIGITNHLVYPVQMDEITGRTIAVKLKWQVKWKTGSVMAIHDGADFVNEIQSSFPPGDGPQGNLIKSDKTIAKSEPYGEIDPFFAHKYSDELDDE
ncbi:hypothetical protein TSUD_386850 [Trifolium subterraneum]|uniref:Replication protein A 70 kDa DNA-binding subunit B/D first OB fold domain-containing protein n=1 Tax=Trifolium subterraneum TaxID=3900 RepID=A0A2Z6P234_TRISU|nr:hypothetical protein TSUD_386850 [Trifolium subterraneum]